MNTSATKVLASQMSVPIFSWLFAMRFMFSQAACSVDSGVGCFAGSRISQRWRRKCSGTIMGISDSRHLLKDTDPLTVRMDL